VDVEFLLFITGTTASSGHALKTMSYALWNRNSTRHLFSVEFHTLTLDIHLMVVELQSKASTSEVSNLI